MPSQVLPVMALPRSHGLHGAHGFRPPTLAALKVAAS
jgi:hypothetical protein